MAWIESHQELRRHPKTIRAARMLECSPAEVVGLLHFLWWWALDYAPRGDLTGYTTEDIAQAIDYTGEQDIVDVLLTCNPTGGVGFLETDDEGTLRIHDWDEFAGKWTSRREADAERKRSARQSAGRPQDIVKTAEKRRADGVRREHNNTVHNNTLTTMSDAVASDPPVKPKRDSNNPNWPVIEAVAEVCNVSAEANAERIGREVKFLMRVKDPPASPELIREHYGLGGTWYEYRWQGADKGQPPEIEHVRKYWAHWLGEKPQPKGNGNVRNMGVVGQSSKPGSEPTPEFAAWVQAERRRLAEAEAARHASADHPEPPRSPPA